MKAISLHAPWAWALMYGGKDVENRAKTFPRRRGGVEVTGRVWVHASVWPGRGALWAPSTQTAPQKWEMFFTEFNAVIRTVQLRGSTHTEHEWPTADAMRGHIVGSVEVYGYQTPDNPPDSPWYVPGSLAIMVRDPKPLVTPVPAQGALGWWTPPAEVLAQLEAQS